MFWRKKEIYKQIDRYGKNIEFLYAFARHIRIEKIQDISTADLKCFYIEKIEQTPSLYFKLEYIKWINKFMREYGVPFILRTDEVMEITPSHAIIEAMKTVNRHNPTPKAQRNKLIVQLKDKGWSYSEICAELGLRSKATVHEIYWREKSRSELSPA